MGWDYHHADYYKNGKIDRKTELDNEFTWESETRSYEVLKSRMVGSTYYAAVKCHVYETGEEYVWALVCLTRTNMKDYFNFGKKAMDETEGPYQYDCPTDILDLLTPTDNEIANEWRKKCREYKKLPKLSSVKEGNSIKFTCPYDTKYHKQGEEIVLNKIKTIHRINGRDSYAWLDDKYIRWPSHMIPKKFEVIKQKEAGK